MIKCEWCGNNVGQAILYSNPFGETKHICKDCNDKVSKSLCRKCGSPTDQSLMMDGLCINCMQIKMREKSRQQEEKMLGVDAASINELTSDVEFNNDGYKHWMTFGQGNFSSSDIKNNKELKRLWIMAKLNATGTYDNKVICKNISKIEKLFDANFDKLINNSCKIVIADDEASKKKVKSSKVIDKIDNVYILEA